LALPQEAEVEVVRASVEVEEEPRIVCVVAAAEVRVAWKKCFLSLFLLLEGGEEASMMFSSRLTCIRSLDPVFVVCVGSLGQTAHSHFSMEICVKSFVREVFQKTQKQLPLLLLKRHRSHVGANSAA
jgi:hypothetical protein